MAKKKVKAGTIVGIGLGAVAVIIIVDHYVLKGQLGIAGRINMLIGKLKGKDPITPAVPTPEAAENLGGTDPGLEFEGSPEEAALLEEEAALAELEPETAYRGRRRRYR